MSLFSLEQHVIVVTGALGRLGRSFCDALLAQGARVAALDLPRVVEQTTMPVNDRLMVLEADVTSETSLRVALAAIEARWERPTGLVNNAAIDTPPDAPPSASGPFETFPVDVWRQVMDVNVTGAFLASQVFGGRMAEAGRGAIVNIGSIYGLVGPDQRIYDYRAGDGMPFVKPASYSASKAALMGLTRHTATYWAPRGVRVNALALGGAAGDQDPRFVDAYASRVPLARMARPEEFHGGLIFLLSDAASYVTGATVVIDGGWTSW